MEPLQTTSADPQPDWALLLPRDAFYEIIRILRGALPPPDTDAPADWERRDRAAMAAVAALRPANAAEGRLAALFVKAESWAGDCLRLAAERRRELEVAHKCKAQALSMMREAKSAWRLLLKAQAERQAIEKDKGASDRASWVEHSAMGMMQEALAPVPAAPAEPVAPVADLAREPALPAEIAGRDGAGEEWKFGPGSAYATRSRSTRPETNARPPPLVRSAA